LGKLIMAMFIVVKLLSWFNVTIYFVFIVNFMFAKFKNNNDFPRVVTLIVPTAIDQISSKKKLQMSSLFYYHLACFNLIKNNYRRLKLEI